MTYAEGRRRGNATVDKRSLELALHFSGLTKTEVARRGGVVPGTLSNLVNGHRKTCSVETAAGIAKALGCETGDIFTLNVFTGQSPVNKGKAAA